MDGKKIFFKSTFWILFILFLSGTAYGSFFIWKINQIGNKINLKSDDTDSLWKTLKNLTPQNNSINLSGAEDKRINILLLGFAGNEKGGKYLTDTIMIASINPETGQTALLSLPRDLYVKISDTELEAKINTLYQYGISLYSENSVDALKPIKKTVEDITSLKINYWIAINFDGFEKIVDSIGGINITNERNILDNKYPGPNYSYETFELNKGFHHLDGLTALKYARSRHNDPQGDFGRAKRQQQVLQAIKNRIFSTGTFLNILELNKLFDTLKENIKTNIQPKEFQDFLKLSRKMDTDNLNNVVVDAWNRNSLLIVSHIFHNNIRLFVLVPRIGDWSEIQELSQNIFDLNILRKRQTEISNENATVVIINKSGDKKIMSRLENLLKKSLNYKNTIIVHDGNKDLEKNTLIYDLSEKTKPFTLDELIKKLPGKLSDNSNNVYQKNISGLSPDILVIVGKDLIERYNMEEDSFEEYNKENF